MFKPESKDEMSDYFEKMMLKNFARFDHFVDDAFNYYK